MALKMDVVLAQLERLVTPWNDILKKEIKTAHGCHSLHKLILYIWEKQPGGIDSPPGNSDRTNLEPDRELT